jgi:probable DNA repair protein
LLELHDAHFSLLESGGTLVVPTRQRAAAVSMAYSSRALRAGRRVWASPDVLPWQAWLTRGLDRVRATGAQVPCRLRSAASWLLWRDAAREACAQALSPDGLAPALRRAAFLQADWDLPASTATAEARALGVAVAFVRGHCREHDLIDPADWSRILPLMGEQRHTAVAGFGVLPPARAAALARIAVLPLEEAEKIAGSVTREVCGDAADELRAAAQWARGALERKPSARLLVVVPQLARHRHRVIRAFAESLNAPGILRPEGLNEPPYAIEGGEPLAQHPLVAAALDVLAVAAGTADFAALSAALRSPYLRLGSDRTAIGAQWDAWLREHGVNDVKPDALRRLRRRAASRRETRFERVLDALLLDIPEVADAPTGWAQRFVELLRQRGWPGGDLDSAEQQVRMRFDELLGELAVLGPTPRLSFADAVTLLRVLASQVRFEPASGDVPITITAALDDPIVRYDGIWVTQLAAHTWPPAAAPDPFLPLAQQLTARIPQASAGGQLTLARASMAAWESGAHELVMSRARAEDDVLHEPSGLLEAWAPELDRSGDSPGESLAAWMWTRRERLERFQDIRGPVWVSPHLPGGTRALELISACAFRSFGELRLLATELVEPQPGIDPRVRGILLHAALERFWRATPDAQTLRAREEGATRRLVSECVAMAAAAAVREAAEPPDDRLLALERQRAVNVILGVLQAEREREPFTVETVEARQMLTLAGRSLQFKLDRVDRLSDGSRAIIDYKTGAPQRFDAFADRLPQPQLPAYALAAGEGVSAVAMLFLGRNGARWRGLADRSDRLPGVTHATSEDPPWAELLERWRRQLTALVMQFAAGDARPDALAETCRRCHLHALCRVDELRLAVALESSAPAEE